MSLFLFASFEILVQFADHGLDDILQEPVHWLVIVEHEEELDQGGQVSALEQLAYEAKLAVVYHKPGKLETKTLKWGSLNGYCLPLDPETAADSLVTKSSKESSANKFQYWQ